MRPTINEIKTKFNNNVMGKTYILPKTTNKGRPGIFLEQLLNIPTSTACLDCQDGELKLYPLKKLSNGNFSVKETVAITMRGLSDKNLEEGKIEWEYSALRKKTNNILFISYYREGDNITYYNSCGFDYTHPCYNDFKNDYDKIINFYRLNGIRESGNTINGKHIQGRTKGPGGSSKKTVAFYFRGNFMKNIILNNQL